MKSRGLLGLFGSQAAADDEPALVEAEVERDAGERERTAQQSPEAGVRQAPARGLTTQARSEREDRPGRQHRESRDEIDVCVADRIDPFTRVAGAVQPGGMRGLDLDDALHG